MARTDRLMRLMDVLRRLPAPVTAARLAAETGVSPRQLYRDIATLRAGGALIDGEAGVGYRLVEDGALPPQTLSRLEVEALQLAVAGLARLGDPALAEAGRDALTRMIATLPEAQMQAAFHNVMRTFIPPVPPRALAVDLAMIRNACWDERSLHVTYRDLKDAETEREILPLGISYSDRTLMLLGWCLLRQDYRMFHVDRMTAARPGDHSFRPRRVPLLRAYIERLRANTYAASGEKIAIAGSAA